jgi:acetyl esterase/lipase
VPVGFLITVGLVALGMAVSLWPPARSGFLGAATWFVSAIVNESPFLAFYYMAASTLLAFSQFHGMQVWVAVGLTIAPFVTSPVLVRRSLRAAPALEQAFDQALGPRWRRAGAGRSIAARPPRGRVLFAPLPLFHPGVRRISNLSYGDAGRRNRLDLYRRRGGASGGPVLIHLHGGGFSLAPGRKSFYARRLLFRLARQGWVCISATYRLAPAATFPDELIDVKKVIAWARARASEHGGDPDRIVLAGSSFGARLATLAGFTTNDPAFQPGFEQADTSVAAVVGLYGYYGATASRQSLPSSPFDYAERGSAPLLIVHGDQDTLTSANTARTLAERARNASANPVVYAELPGAQHSFDLLSSIRFEAVIDGIEAFTATITAQEPSPAGRANQLAPEARGPSAAPVRTLTSS